MTGTVTLSSYLYFYILQLFWSITTLYLIFKDTPLFLSIPFRFPFYSPDFWAQSLHFFYEMNTAAQKSSESHPSLSNNTEMAIQVRSLSFDQFPYN